MIINNLLLVTIKPDKTINKVPYYIDTSIYSTIASLHNKLVNNLGKIIEDNFNIFYFYNGKMLSEFTVIDSFTNLIIAYCVSKPKIISTGYHLANAEELAQTNITNTFMRLLYGTLNLNNIDISGNMATIHNMLHSLNNSVDSNGNDNGNDSESDNIDEDDYIDEEPEQIINDYNINTTSIFDQYQSEYLNMISMGFTDENLMATSLQISNGNVEMAINYYLQSGN